MAAWEAARRAGGVAPYGEAIGRSLHGGKKRLRFRWESVQRGKKGGPDFGCMKISSEG